MLSTWTSYNTISGALDRNLKATSQEVSVKRESQYYLANIEKVKSIDDFLGNQRLFTYAMKAYGLDDMTYAKAFMKKVLTEGIDDKTSFANKLTDNRFREFAAAFNFKRYGETTTVFDRTRQGTVDKYVRQTLEANAGKQNEGVRLALYFERKASTITGPYNILADKALTNVVQTVLNLPPQTSALDIEKQATLLSSKLNYADFQDPTKMAALLQKFAAKYDVANNTSAQSPTVQLFQGGATSTIMNTDILNSIQSLKR